MYTNSRFGLLNDLYYFKNKKDYGKGNRHRWCIYKSKRHQSIVDYKWENENNPAVPGHTVFSFFKAERVIILLHQKQCVC